MSFKNFTQYSEHISINLLAEYKFNKIVNKAEPEPEFNSAYDELDEIYSNFNNNDELNDELNEGLFNAIWTKITNWFIEKFGKHAWSYNLLFLQKKGQLKKWGIEYYCNTLKNKNVPDINIKNLEEGIVGEENPLDLSHPSKEVKNVDVKGLKMNLRYAVEKKSPLFIWGAPGVGKTDIVKQIADEYGKDLIIFNLSLKDPTDFVGVPEIVYVDMPDATGKIVKVGRTRYATPLVFPTTNGENGKGGIIFFDEMNRAAIPVIKASLQFVLDRKLGGGLKTGDYELPSEWVIISAGNRSSGEENADVEDLGSALGNRFHHVNLVADPASWEKWLKTKEKDPDSDIQIAKEILLSSHMLAFIKFNEKYFHRYIIGEESPVWASPRSWVEAAKKYAWYEKIAKTEGKELTDQDILDALETTIGKTPAMMFIAFKNTIAGHMDDKDIDYVYSDPDKAKIPPSAPLTFNVGGGKDKQSLNANVAQAMMSAIAYKRSRKKITSKELINVVKYSIRLKQMEWANLLVKMILDVHPYLKTEDPDGVQKAIKLWSDTYKQEFWRPEDQEKYNKK